MSDAPVTLSAEVRALVANSTLDIATIAPMSGQVLYSVRTVMYELAAAIVAETQRACLPVAVTLSGGCDCPPIADGEPPEVEAARVEKCTAAELEHWRKLP